MELAERYKIAVTEEEIANGLKDEYGCIYSQDGKRLLKAASDLKTYTIKEGTEVICTESFQGCSELQSVVFSDSVKAVGSDAFCCEKLESVKLSESLELLFNGAFLFCNSLKSIVFPKSLTKIGAEAFWGCEALKIVVLPDTPIDIEQNVFKECISLKSIELPKSIARIGGNAFPKEIKITSHSERYVVKNDLFIDLKEQRLVQCLKNKESVKIPKNIVTIDTGAFEECELLEKIELPETLTTIGSDAFSVCAGLKSITLPETVTSIGDGAFFLCSSLEDVTMFDSIEEIHKDTFRECSSLARIYIPMGKKKQYGVNLKKRQQRLLKEIDYRSVSDFYAKVEEEKLKKIKNTKLIHILDIILTIIFIASIFLIDAYTK